MKEKTPENKRKAGRPFGVPTSVISVRIPTELKEKADSRFGNHWASMFRHFVEVYLLEKEPIEFKKK
jgi:hypothetical protein